MEVFMLDNIPEVSPRSATNVDLHVGARVRERRVVIGWSQEKLAETLGLTFQQVQKYEKGINRIGASRLYEIARTLGVPISYFFDEIDEGVEHTPASSPIAEMLSTKDGVEMASAFCRITDMNKRRALLGVARAMGEMPSDPSVSRAS
jgi:transcriptional regulator with XRE-family HTH domain